MPVVSHRKRPQGGQGTGEANSLSCSQERGRYSAEGKEVKLKAFKTQSTLTQGHKNLQQENSYGYVKNLQGFSEHRKKLSMSNTQNETVYTSKTPGSS